MYHSPLGKGGFVARPSRRVLSVVAAGLALVAGASYGQNLANRGFESGSMGGWSASYGSYSVNTSDAWFGQYCAWVAYGSAVQQTVTGLKPNTTYTVSACLKVSMAGQRAYLGVNGYGGTSVAQSTTSSNYVRLSQTFTTGGSSTSATIFVYHSGSGVAFCDDFSLFVSSGDLAGTTAFRIADCLERFGVNTFSKVDYEGTPWAWGGSQGDYDAATTSRAVNYITNNSGLKMNIREYHLDTVGGRQLTPHQKTWMRSVHLSTGARFTVAIGANGNASSISGILELVRDSIDSGMNYVKWVEGINEPDMNFGLGTTPVETTASCQSLLFQEMRKITPAVPVAGPSVTFGLPNPENALNGYLGSHKQTVLNNSDLNNLHIYPPQSPNAADGSTRPGTLADIDAGFKAALPGKAAYCTEFHTTLYSHYHRNDPVYDAYWAPIILLSAFLDYDWKACFWFSLYDYNASMLSGLFASSDTNPRASASAFRALFTLTGDAGASKLTFAPGKLDFTISGLPAAPAGAPRAGGRWALFQNSQRTFFLFVWNEQNTMNAATVPVVVNFNAHTVGKVEEFNITSGSLSALQVRTLVQSFTINLDTSVRLLRITF